MSSEEHEERQVPILSPSRPRRGAYSEDFRQRVVGEVVGHITDGLSIKAACTKAGVSHRTLHYWRQEHEDIRADVQRAIDFRQEIRLEDVEETQFQQAVQGGSERATEFFLRHHAPEKYREELHITHHEAPSDEQLALIRAMRDDPDLIKAGAMILDAYGHLDDPDVVDSA